ncbi:suppressor of fused domain protein [Streptomyces sp. NPDC050422]|uniref:suppressor of fused domain protein n=1 Tax=Streptomyces sp. NPDC050422 TaxID=3365614 RepID=UPI0037AAB1E9
MNSLEEGRRSALARHLHASWPHCAHVDSRWQAGGIEELVPGFQVRCIAPSDDSEPWVYVSLAASIIGGDSHEFALLSPVEYPRHVETLTMLAHWQAAGRAADVGSVLELGWPWMEGGEAEHLLITPLYAYPPECGTFRDGAQEVDILWVVPVHASEVAYLRRRGMQKLEERFEKRGVNLLDPRRESVVGSLSAS